MRIIIATTQVPFVRGGAEIHAEGLRDAFQAEGHEAEIAAIPFKWYPPERILDMIAACRLLDLTESCGNRIDLLVGLKFPAYYIPHPRKALWILHQYRAAYDLWEHALADLHRYPNGRQVRDAIERNDRRLIPEARAVFANSKNVAARLLRYCDIQSQPLYHPPPNAERYHGAASVGDYLFFPSRLNRAKRQELAIEALTRTSRPVEIRFAGMADEPAHENSLHALARKLGVNGRIRWLGNIPEDEKIELYAHAIGVLYPPLDEDYGYVSLEAMLAAKPLITCTDSGGPLEFVVEGETGLVTNPAAGDLAAAMDCLWENRGQACRLGQAARDRYSSLPISWKNVTGRLLNRIG